MFRTIAASVCATIIAHSAAAESGGDSATTAWCTVGRLPIHSTRDVNFILPQADIHIVVASEQDDAKKRLSNASFLQLEASEVAKLVGETVSTPTNSHFYLVRAAAAYVYEGYKTNATLHVRLYQDDGTLEVMSLMAYGPTPTITNLALVIETKDEVRQVDVVCFKIVA